ncbi:MAG: hypothetical protein GY785_26345 [Gammaproteobacteria bacterium]|nr:hypothetical protein [Gammaproteobacteria bacterium]
MKVSAVILVSSLLLGIGVDASAADSVLSSRSAGKPLQDDSVDLSRELRWSESLIRAKPTVTEDYASRQSAQRFVGVANRYDQVFEIYSADVQLLADLDGDGFHHAIRVFFDVDVDYDGATVYAKLYLSRDGGPWSQYFTTDLFSIFADDDADAYEVETELMEGYATGYYAVLVEVYSLDHAYMVSSEVLDYQTLGRNIMVEDLGQDEPYVEPYEEYYEEEVHYSSGAGSLASLLLVFLTLQVVIAARGSLALCPRNEGGKYKNDTP